MRAQPMPISLTRCRTRFALPSKVRNFRTRHRRETTLHESGLIFSRSGYALRSYCVSPYLYPQFGQYNKYFLPKHRDLPSHGLVTRMYVLDFGYSNQGNQIAPYQLEQCPLVLGRDFLVWGVT